MTIMSPASHPDRVDGPAGPLNHILLWLRRHMSRLHAALAALATLGVLSALFAFLVFALLAAAVARGITQGPDEQVLRWFEAHRSPVLDFVMTELTTLGNVSVLSLMAGITALVLWSAGHRWSVLLLTLAAAGGLIINNALKEFFDRGRPEVVEAIAHVMSPSFPSGHAMNSLVIFGSVAYIIGRLEPTALLERLTWLAAALLILGIGVSRVYLGVHYPSDVIAGFVAGFGWLAILPAGIEVLRYFDPSDGRAEASAPERSARRR
jgi:membrane-associated phospholipid phosphatase